MASTRLLISTNFYGDIIGHGFDDSLSMGDLTDVQLTRIELYHDRFIDSFTVNISVILVTGIG